MKIVLFGPDRRIGAWQNGRSSCFSSFTSFSSVRAFEQFNSFQPFTTINVVQSSLNLLFSPYESRTSFLSFRKLFFQPSPF